MPSKPKAVFLAREIRDLRSILGLSESELAQLLRVTPRLVSRWESEETELPPTIRALFSGLRMAALVSPASGANLKELIAQALVLGGGIEQVICCLAKQTMGEPWRVPLSVKDE